MRPSLLHQSQWPALLCRVLSPGRMKGHGDLAQARANNVQIEFKYSKAAMDAALRGNSPGSALLKTI